MSDRLTIDIQTSAMAATAAIRNRAVSVAELTAYFLAQIEQRNSQIGAIRHVLADQAIETARKLDAQIRDGEDLPQLAGLPVVVKENCDTAGVACSAGLSWRENHVPTSDSDITARLRRAGAVILGVSVSDPGAFSVRTPDVTHPIDPTLTVGGSSGGSAAALAAGFCLGAIGTDTGGSIRIPSACCGTAGLKPTFGALPMDGIFPLVRSLDHVGPMANTVDDVALMWQALSGHTLATEKEVKRIGFDPRWVEVSDQPIQAAFNLALDKLKSAGIESVEVKLPDLDSVIAFHGQIFMVESTAYHYAHHGDNISAYPELAREWFAIAREMSVSTYVDACAARVRATDEVNSVLEKVDALIEPTLFVMRPKKDATFLTFGGDEHDYTMGMARSNCLFDQTGHPALAMPIDATGNPLPPSLQIVGRRGGEADILQLATKLEHGLQ